MLVSHSHKFIFLHNPKVAGSSIRNVLSKYAEQPSQHLIDRLLIKLGLKERPLYSHHLRARIVKERLPQHIYDEYFKFAFVRNPWDLQVSLYYYMLKSGLPEHQHVRQMKSFEQYLEWRVQHRLRLQKDFITDEDGKVIVDFIGKFENLEEDFNFVCKTLDIDESLPHLNKSKHFSYQQHYNDYTRQLVEEHFKQDIDFFGYTFDKEHAEVNG